MKMTCGAKKDMIGKYVAPIDQNELAVRLLESVTRMARPRGFTAVQSLDALGDGSDVWKRAAITALMYFGECIAKANASQGK